SSPPRLHPDDPYCHLRGVKVYLTLNTLASDREMADAVDCAVQASQLGADAVLVQDMGLVRALRQAAPDLPLHASTQMTLHSLDGVKQAADLGVTRAVLARELSRRDIAYICEHSPIEIEVFVHGALCMCYSGQCFMSSVIGGRSGNRGMCAQPCRLPYGWGDELISNHPLSLKDMSLAGHLKELRDMGVASAKIEGRMKRPEYVYIVTKVYADALRDGREPTAEELSQLEQAFSRQGFTDGYFMEQKGPDMFGVREEAKHPRELFAQAKAAYEKGEGPGVPVKFYALVRPGEPIQVGVEDDQGHVVTAAGSVPEAARRRVTTRAEVEGQLTKTGGTPYRVIDVRSLVQDGLAVPLSALNGLRRQVLDDLSRQRTALPQRRHGAYKLGARYENYREEPDIIVSLRKVGQMTFELTKARPAMITLPAEEIAAHPDDVKTTIGRGVPVAAVLPRICFDRELDGLRKELEACKEAGVTDAYVGNLGLIPLCKKLGFNLRGDFGLQVFNSQGVKEYKRLGFQSLTASFELKLAQIRDISKAVDVEMIAYGRLPLMITENCAIKNQSGKCVCSNVNLLTDRKGVRFPVERAYGCRNEILNANKVFLADKAADWKRAGLRSIRLLFTTENGVECVQVLDAYRGKGNYTPNNYTRGLYYRDVE
ncbi:MAG: U32 family peptidase, partial [Oscillospiraceae bacterium]|nr:U32 family peptidase [Oscillospiraceae bacterium]